MEPWLIALLLKPFVALVVFGLLAMLRVYLQRALKPGKLKRLLLLPVGKLRRQRVAD